MDEKIAQQVNRHASEQQRQIKEVLDSVETYASQVRKHAQAIFRMIRSLCRSLSSLRTSMLSYKRSWAQRLDCMALRELGPRVVIFSHGDLYGETLGAPGSFRF